MVYSLSGSFSYDYFFCFRYFFTFKMEGGAGVKPPKYAVLFCTLLVKVLPDHIVPQSDESWVVGARTDCKSQEIPDALIIT